MKTLQQHLAELTPENRAEIERLAEEFAAENGLPSIREMRAMSQQELAERLGVTQPAVAAMERRGDDIKVSTLKRYAEALGGELKISIELPEGSRVISL
ncbi:helix-turn-helix domain-containing protein [Atlantibacter subterraneus]|uniref:helix-turn-helix domain-containing protein n=1 Tax=Atlantibacter subterraneus TaxID=255519 RepID=UPI002898B6D9|nr:helix-turn-helix domain-containing protein [Atlantibacter subterranea]